MSKYVRIGLPYAASPTLEKAFGPNVRSDLDWIIEGEDEEQVLNDLEVWIQDVYGEAIKKGIREIALSFIDGPEGDEPVPVPREQALKTLFKIADLRVIVGLEPKKPSRKAKR